MFRILLTLLMVLALAAPVMAQEATPALLLATAYPSQEIEAGDAVSISLDVRNIGLPAQIVSLEIQQVPEGWTANFQGGGRVVHSVFVGTDETRTVSLNVDVPDGTAEGSYRMRAVARGEGGQQSTLPLELIVGAGAPPQLSIKAELPVLKGTPSSTFSYRLKIENDSEQEMLVSLEYEAPETFRVVFRSSGQEVTTLPIDAGQTKQVDASVSFVDTIAAGEYPFLVRVQGENVSDEVDLTAVVSGQPQLNLSGLDGRLSGQANAGRETPIELVIKNTGTAPAEDVRLEANSPATWNVAFEPAVIEALGPNEELQVTARIQPPEQAVAGDYVVTLKAVPAGGGTEQAEYRVTVTTSTMWGVVGLVLIAAALGVVALAVSRFGRR